MSKAVTVTFAPEGIREIQLYVTSKWAKKTASQVRKLTGADVVINGSLYDAGKWVPNCDVKADGKVLSDDKYSYRGLGWSSGEGVFHVVTSAEMGKWDNFLSCVLLIWQGAAYQYHADAAVSRRSGRTVIIGLKDGTTVLRCFPDGPLGKTPAELQAAILREFPADLVVGTGGYASYPMVKYAAKEGIPTAVHESNMVPGLTTKMLEGYAGCIMVGFEECRQHYKHPEKIVVTGTPVRGDFFRQTREQARQKLGLTDDRPLAVSL